MSQGRSRGGHTRTPPPVQQPIPPVQPVQPAQGQPGAGAPAVSAPLPQARRDGDQAAVGEARRRKRRRRGRRGGAGRATGEVVTEGTESGAEAGNDTAHADDRDRPADPAVNHDEPTGRGAGAETPPPTDREPQ